MFEDIDDDFIDDDFDDEDFADEDAPPEESSNRTFLIAMAVLGLVTVLLLLCLGSYVLFQGANGGNGNRAQQETQVAENQAAQTQVEAQSQMTLSARQATDSAPTATLPPTETPTPTEVIVESTSTEAPPTEDPRTATVAALLTEAAGATAGPTATQFPTQLPDTGLVDDVGIPGLLGLAALSIVLIFLVRRLRTAPS
jgi:LPXTG-motif cell wall-anchored protein